MLSLGRVSATVDAGEAAMVGFGSSEAELNDPVAEGPFVDPLGNDSGPEPETETGDESDG